MDQPRDQPSDLPTPLPPLTSGPQYGPEWWTERHTTAWERAEGGLAARLGPDEGRLLQHPQGPQARRGRHRAPDARIGADPTAHSPTHALDADDLHAARAKRDEGLGKGRRHHRRRARPHRGGARRAGQDGGELSREQSAADHKALDARAAKLETEARATVAAAAERASRETGKQSARLAEAERERTEAHRAWDEAESDARYGFGVRLQHAVLCSRGARSWRPR